jgi:membrane protease YdiL (CAAX protease family)
LLTVAGFIALLVLLVLVMVGKVKGRLTTGSPTGGIYAETFAVWLVLFLDLSWLAHRALPEWGFLASGLGALGSLVALAYPVVRGIPWRQVREEIGWTAGRHPVLESAVGLAGIVLELPMLALGLLLVFVMMSLQKGMRGMMPVANGFDLNDLPVHPIVPELLRGDWRVWAQVLFLGSVVAPVVEETMFRGVLYRHLREATRRWGSVLSGLASASVVAYLFAVIHPQGWLAIPALMALSYTFTMLREWRGTLLPGMVAHGVHNGLIMLMAILLLRE